MVRHAAIPYQPALDGVRALAVIAVLLFHGRVPGASGGYLGVSVFFTLSGFLITSLLIAEHGANGRVDPVAFYARRLRRLLPASMICVVAVVVLAATTDWFAGVSDLRRQVIGAVLQVANWVQLAGGGSYQDLFEQASGAVSPLEHYWSLAIEEQFYWVWPLVFLALVRVAPSARRRLVVLGAATAAAAVAAPVIAVVWGPDAAYWSTPARLAEILAGALLAVAVAGRRLPDRVALAAPLALGALTAAVVWFPASGGPAYAGALPLVAIASVALLAGLQVDGPVRVALGTRPLVWLGGISYGVYLYHWPVFVVLDAPRTGLDGVPLFAVRVGVTLALAQLSYRLIEHPIRVGRRLPRRAVFGTAATATIAAVTLTVVLVPSASGSYWAGQPGLAEAAAIRPSDEPLAVLQPVQPPAGPTEPASPVSAPSATPPVATEPAATVAIDPSAPPAPLTTNVEPVVPSRPVRIVVAGDSTAEATGAGLVWWAASNPALAQAVVDAQPGCGFVRGGDLLVEDWRPVHPRCDEWLDVSLPARVAELDPDVVMLMTTSWDVLDRRWSADEVLRPTDPEFRARIVADFEAITTRVLSAGAGRVAWVIEPIPNVFWWSSGQAQEDPARHDVLAAVMRSLADGDPSRVAVVDLSGWLTDSGLDDDRDVRPDGVHWAPEASAAIAEQFLGEQLVRIALGAER